MFSWYDPRMYISLALPVIVGPGIKVVESQTRNGGLGACDINKLPASIHSEPYTCLMLMIQLSLECYLSNASKLCR